MGMDRTGQGGKGRDYRNRLNGTGRETMGDLTWWNKAGRDETRWEDIYVGRVNTNYHIIEVLSDYPSSDFVTLTMIP